MPDLPAALRTALLDRVRIRGGTTELAADADCSHSSISHVVAGRRRPSDGLLKALGWERTTVYRPTRPASTPEP